MEVGVFTSFSTAIVDIRLTCQDMLRATLPAFGHPSRQQSSPNACLLYGMRDRSHTGIDTLPVYCSPDPPLP